MAYFSDVRPLERTGGSVDRPLRDAFRLPAIGASVAEARRRVLARLTEWDIGTVIRDDAQLVVSELFTNAVRHTDSERVDCELRVTGVRLRLAVTDQGSGNARHAGGAAEAPADTRGEGENGRGLLLVSALAEAWGVRPGAGGRGHMVWAELGFGPSAP
ncbi:ATP-binding protein [Streptomyces radiopugnans]|uniref:Anti-sigma regulatory factor (Ser/Thr protein kinase) n=1 Tax=Streptomyces radiopugnans TaxID=403935 RepID=A0A1H9K6I5_9ACTN|nr:ATP-binding protein [Streptomyces radiopugnans]SEQ94740.1 Anti-sigma regulatory factor (Ser/Thr protein kinase) [Streptomyces radiopugnans]